MVAKKLGGANLYSIRVGSYRIIVGIEMGNLVALVIDVGHRSKIYKNF